MLPMVDSLNNDVLYTEAHHCPLYIMAMAFSGPYWAIVHWEQFTAGCACASVTGVSRGQIHPGPLHLAMIVVF